MDREKVINGLEFTKAMITFNPSTGEDIEPENLNEADKTTYDACVGAIALLKEQEAKQVIRKQCKREHDDGAIDYFAEWYCPHCNLLILRGFDNPSIKFCYKCGKPVLWEGH